MKKLIMITLITASLSSCYNDKYDKLYPASPTVTCDTTNVSYKTDIQPIVNGSCAISGGCHDAAGMATSGLDFTNFDVLQSQATPNLIVADINWTPTANHHNMPLNLSKLPQCDINKFTRWVNQGAPNN